MQIDEKSILGTRLIVSFIEGGIECSESDKFEPNKVNVGKLYFQYKTIESD